MFNLKALFTTFALLAFVALLIASWYVIVILAVVAIVYFATTAFYSVREQSWKSS